MDDLIFSGAGSGCRGDDEDECTPPFEAGSGDDLITPVYVPPTKQPQNNNNNNNNGKNKSTDATTGERACDDEDCLHGSGAGEITESSKNTGGGGLFERNTIGLDCMERSLLLLYLDRTLIDPFFVSISLFLFLPRCLFYCYFCRNKR